MADGNLKFDTKIDTDGFRKGVNTLKNNFNSLKSTIKGTGKAVDDAFSGRTSSKVVDLNGKIEQTESQIKSLRAEMEKMASTPFVSKEADRLTAQVDKAEQQLLSLLNQREQLEEGLKGGIADLGLPTHSPEVMKGLYEANTEWQKLTSKIMQAESTLTQYESKLQDVRQADAKVSTTGTAEYAKKEQKLQGLMNKLDVYKAKLNEVRQAEEKKASSANNASKSTDRLAGSMKRANKTAIPLTKSILKLSSMFKLMLMRMAIRATINAVKEGFENLAQVSPELNKNLSLLKSSLTQLKNSLATAFAPVISIVTPILNSLIQTLSRAANAVAQFFAILGGKGSYQKAVEVQQDYAEGLKDTGKQAKKTAKDVKKSLTSIDDVNILSAGGSDADAGGSGGSAGLLPSDMFETVSVSEKAIEIFDKLKVAMQPTLDALKRLGDQLTVIKGFAFEALQDFYNSFLVPVGNWVLGEGLPRFIDAITNGLAVINWQRINDSLSGLWKVLAPFAINVGEGLLWLWENVLVPIGSWTISNILPIFIDALSGGLGVLNGVIDALKGPAGWIWDNFLQPIAEWTGGVIVSVLEKLVEKLQDFSDWVNKNTTAVENIAIVIGSFVTAWGTVKLATTIGGIVTALATFVTTGGLAATVGGVLAGVIAFLTSPITIAIAAITALIAAGVLLYRNWDTVKAKCTEIWGSIKAFIGNILGQVGQFFSNSWANIKSIFSLNNVRSFFNGVLNGIKNVFSSIPQWFKSKFTEAWTNVKNVFSAGGKIFTGIKDGIASTFKTIVNGLISGINRIISVPFNSINGMLNTIRNVGVLGIRPFSGLWSHNPLRVPSIPRLATGTVVPANYGEFVAILGDNKRETEVVSPLSTMKQAMKEALKESGNNNGGTTILKVYLEGKQIYQEVVKQNNQNTRRTGINALADV